MKIINVEKNFSWLQFPVTLKSLTDDSIKNPHITFKFLGETMLDVEKLKELVQFQQLDDRNCRAIFSPTFTFEIFHDLAYVLKLDSYDPMLDEARAKFDFFPDQFPKWQPHITVRKAFWDMLKDSGQDLSNEIVDIGPLELCLGAGRAL